MAIVNKKPAYVVSVKDAYICFLDTESGATLTYSDAVTQLPVLKELTVTPSTSEKSISASGKIYDKTNKQKGAEIGVEAVAFPSEIVNEALGKTAQSGYVIDATNDTQKVFAFGAVYEKSDGSLVYAWYPYCKLAPGEESYSTSEEDDDPDPGESYTINAMPAPNNVWRVRYFTELVTTGTPATESEYFATPIYEIPNGEG